MTKTLSKKLMEKLWSTEMDFWSRVALTPNILKERMNLKKKMGITQFRKEWRIIC
jgi:hypothetical protein